MFSPLKGKYILYFLINEKIEEEYGELIMNDCLLMIYSYQVSFQFAIKPENESNYELINPKIILI